MEEIKDSVGVHPNGPASRRIVGSEAHGVRELASGRGRHGLILLVLLYRDLLAAVLAADALGNVDAGLGGVAGFTGVERVVLRGGGGLLVVGARLVRTLRVGTLPLRRVAGGCGVGLAVAGDTAGLGSSAVALLARGISRRGLEGGVDCVGDVGHVGGVRRVGAFPLACCRGT